MSILSDKDINELQDCNKKIWVTTDDIEKIVENDIQKKLGLNIHESFNDVEINHIKASKLYNNTSLYIYYSMYLLFNIDKKNDPTDDDNNVDNINIGLNGDSEISLNIGDKYNEKSVIVIENEKTDVTDKATINITIVRKSDGKTVNEITTSSADIYTVTYKVKYKKASKTLTRKVNIVGTLYNG